LSSFELHFQNKNNIESTNLNVKEAYLKYLMLNYFNKKFPVI